MKLGSVLGGRYVVEARAGAGGMGTVYRGVDRQSGEPVAIKVLTDRGPDLLERFSRETRVLANLSHPAIVRYVGHGSTDDGHPFLAMEWLEGEDLRQRLARRPFALDEALAVVGRTAEALAVAHEAGVVHRDLKPSNLFLVGCEPQRTKVLDFGVARRLAGTRVLTSTGAIVGTIGYMAPEQLQGVKDIDARADVFALGCVLFECLTGKRAFSGHNAVAVLAKLLIDEVPRVQDLRPELPEVLDALLALWMAKARQERPADAREARAMLEELATLEVGAPVRPSRTSLAPDAEQPIVHLLVLEREAGQEDETRRPGQVATERARLAEIVDAHQGDLATVSEGLIVVLFRGGGAAATDQATRAAACALALSDAFADAKIALATGRAETGGQMPVGPAIDAAVALLEGAQPREVRLDALTEGLLGPRFRVASHVLLGEHDAATPVRRLLGKPTPFVGRRKELRLLEATLDACVEDGRPEAVLITAPAGTGKSRLLHEFVHAIRERGGVRVLSARGTPVGARSAFLVARQLVRSAIESAEPQTGTSFDRLARHVDELPLDSPPRVAEFLGEMIGTPTAGPPSRQLEAGRRDGRIMAEWLERSFIAWLDALARHEPVLLAIEDLHWADQLTVQYLDRLLQNRGALRLMVVATARPEVHDAFAHLFGGDALQEVRLQALSPRASAELVQAVMGENIAQPSVDRLVALSEGNAFYLEELVRHAAEARGDLPETVLAMVEGRLLSLEPEARRILRAASILGERFRQDAVAALLLDDSAPADIGGWLDALADRELLERLPKTTHRTDPTHAFRHALVREAAYGMLTSADRVTGHRIAGEWLEACGDADPLVLLHHFERAGDAEGVVRHAILGSRAAFDGGDYVESDRIASIGLAQDPSGVERGRLLVLRGSAVGWEGRFEEALCFREAMGLLPAGSPEWTEAVAGAIYVGVSLVREEVVLEALAAMMSAPAAREVTPAYARGIFIAALALPDAGHAQVASELASGLEARIGDDDDAARAWLEGARAWLALTSDRRLALALGDGRRSVERFERLGDSMGMAGALTAEQQGIWEAGELDRALAMAAAHPHPELADQWVHAILMQGATALRRRRPEEARTLVASVLDVEPRYAGPARALAALASAALGEMDEADELMRRALETTGTMSFGPTRVFASAARLALLRSDVEAALGHAEAGLARADGGTCLPTSWLELSLARAEALLALEREAEGREALATARSRLEAAREGLPEVTREAFVQNHPSHRRILELAETWLEAD